MRKKTPVPPDKQPKIERSAPWKRSSHARSPDYRLVYRPEWEEGR